MSSKIPQNFLIVSVPEDRHGSAYNTVEQKTRRYCSTTVFNLPQLKDGALDERYRLDKQFDQLDAKVEKAVKRIGKWLFKLYREDQKDITLERALPVHQATMHDFVRGFTWDQARYPTKQSKAELINTIVSETDELLTKLQTQTNEFNTVDQSIQAEEKRQGGNLFVKDLSEVVDGSRLISTEYLKTLLVVVPRSLEKDFLQTYYSVCPGNDATGLPAAVVPDSIVNMNVTDKENSLYAILVLRKREDDLRNQLRESRYGVRDVPVFEEGQATGHELLHRLRTKREELKADLIRWCQTVYSEVFIAWLHLKTIGLVMRSVLRYGPSKFTALALLVNSKSSEEKVLKELSVVYQSLGPPAPPKGLQLDVEVYPFVKTDLNLSLEMSAAK